MNKKITVLLSILLLLFFSCGKRDLETELSERKIDLRLKYDKTEQLKYDIVNDMEIETEILGMTFSAPAKQTIGITNIVDNIDADGIYHVTQTIDYFEYESELIDLDEESFQDIQIKMQISPKGVIKTQTNSFDFNTFFEGEVDYNKILDTFYGFLPEEPVGLNSEWEKKTGFFFPDETVNLKLNKLSTYRLTGVSIRDEYPCVEIEMEGTISIDADFSKEVIQSKMDTKGSGTFTGKIYFAPEEGRVVFSESEIDLTIMNIDSKTRKNPLTEMMKGASIGLHNKITIKLRE